MVTNTQTNPTAVQGCLDDLGTPLHDVTFVIVDLETAGGRPGAQGITEIGAVKVRGGEVLGEFATLVDPGCAIPPQIQRLTGITTAMVHDAPKLASVLPAFFEFLGPDAVLVAHNAPFDVGFLTAAARDLEVPWPAPAVVDTVKLARALVPRDEVRNHRLGTLAAHFGASVNPNHRALADAQATVDVLHALLSRAGSLGVTSREELLSFSAKVPAARRRKATLADGLPAEPGVYVFENEDGKPLYVGTSGNLRTRVRSYFTASEKRREMGLMVDLAARVTPIPCATALEAHVREIRLIAEHRPRFNRRSSRPEKIAWLKITDEKFPRLSVVREQRADEATYLGPFRTMVAARLARDAVHDVRRIRQCTTPIRAKGGTACVLAEMDRCDAPCIGGITQPDYLDLVSRLRQELLNEPGSIVNDVEARLARLAGQERFEEARAGRDALIELLRGLDRHQRRAPIVNNPHLMAARPRRGGGWEFAVIRHGRLAASGASRPGQDPRLTIEALRATAEAVATPPAHRSAALEEETEVLLRWIARAGTRIVETDAPWVSPRDAATRYLDDLDPVVRRAHEAAAVESRLLAHPGQGRATTRQSSSPRSNPASRSRWE